MALENVKATKHETGVVVHANISYKDGENGDIFVSRNELIELCLEMKKLKPVVSCDDVINMLGSLDAGNKIQN